VAWAKQTMAKLQVPQVNKLREQLAGYWPLAQGSAKFQVPELSRRVLFICGGVLLGLYLFHSYCCLSICRKCGCEPGAAVWIPLLQIFPLLKAASMSPWWFVCFLVPGINLIAQIVWFIKISQARGKGLGLAMLLIFPLTNPFAALYLAFAGGEPSRREKRQRVEIMTLEAA